MSAIVTNGLIGHWHHKQGFNGSTWDNISPNTQGQWQGIVNGVVSQPDGLFFDGIDDFIEITRPNSSHSYMTNFTFEAFVKPNVSGYNPLFYSHYINHFSINSNDMLHLKGTNENTGVTSNSGIAKDMWYTLTFTVGNGKFSLYIDGILVGEKTTNGYITIYGYVITAYPLLIGRIIGSGSSATEGKFNGLIKSARMYDRTLTPQEITQNHDEDLRELIPPPSPQIVTDGLVGYWHYKQGVVGNTWGNISPSTKGRYNGVISGANLHSEGVYLDGIDDKVIINEFDNTLIEYTVETIFKSVKDSYFVILSGRSNDEGTHLSIGVQPSSSSDGLYLQIGAMGDTGTMSHSPSGFKLLTNKTHTLTLTLLRKEIGYISYIYLDGVQVYYHDATISKIDIGLGSTIGFGNQITNNFSMLNGYIMSQKIYNRVLSSEEVQQNYLAGTEVGLPQSPISSPPKPTITLVSKSKISDEPNMDRSYITFKFNEDVTQWTVNVLGVSHDTGFVADSGGAVTANTEITAEIDWTELQQEGQNKVSIYGKNNAGWTNDGGTEIDSLDLNAIMNNPSEWENGLYNASNGSKTTNGTRLRYKHRINVQANETYMFRIDQSGYWFAVQQYNDIEGSATLRDTNWQRDGFVLTMLPDTKYIVVMVRRVDNGTISVDEILNAKLAMSWGNILTTFEDGTGKELKKLTAGKNKFNGVMEAGTIDGAGGSPSGFEATHSRSKYFSLIEGNKQYTQSNDLNAVMSIVFYTNNSVYISSTSETTFTTPANASLFKIRVTTPTSSNVKVQVEEGNTKTAYEPFTII